MHYDFSRKFLQKRVTTMARTSYLTAPTNMYTEHDGKNDEYDQTLVIYNI